MCRVSRSIHYILIIISSYTLSSTMAIISTVQGGSVLAGQHDIGGLVLAGQHDIAGSVLADPHDIAQFWRTHMTLAALSRINSLIRRKTSSIELPLNVAEIMRRWLG